MTPNEYQEKAQRTAPPITPEMVARIKDTRTLSTIARLMSDIQILASNLDLVKKHIFYGKGMQVEGLKTLPEADEAAERITIEGHVKIIHGIIGFVTEAGEMAEALLNWLFIGQELDETNLMEECGDGLWYMAELLQGAGFGMEETMQKNIHKLMERYGDKFSEERALNRELDKERVALERPQTHERSYEGRGSTDHQ